MSEISGHGLEEYTWLAYNRVDNFDFGIVKSVQKLRSLTDGLSREPQGRNIQNTALCGPAGAKEH